MQLVVEFLCKRNQTEPLDTFNVFRIMEHFITCSDGAESEVPAIKNQDLCSKMACTLVSKIGVSHRPVNDIYDFLFWPAASSVKRAMELCMGLKYWIITVINKRLPISLTTVVTDICRWELGSAWVWRVQRVCRTFSSFASTPSLRSVPWLES
jgi:hypothetical protein